MDEIYFAFQPIVKEDMSLYAYEALMRLKNCSIQERISKCQTVEDYKQLETITFFEALKQYKERNLNGRLFVNSFPNTFLSTKDLNLLVSMYGDILNKLTIEILESPDIDDRSINKKISFSKKYGCLIAIDDFGTGNFGIDKEITIVPDIVKLDRSLISNINSNPDKQEILKELITKFNDKIVLAEGVETKEEYECMKELGAKLFQGYYIGRPS